MNQITTEFFASVIERYQGVDELISEIDDRWAALGEGASLEKERQNAGLNWLRETIQEHYGKKGWERLAETTDATKPPFTQWQAVSAQAASL